MITNTGKSILSKYLVGQINTYASHISVGCGSEPLADTDIHDTGSYATKPAMDFEILRLPIISRGYITENNQTKISLTAELPSLERYEITEVGLWSNERNPIAGSNDSRILFSFGSDESWKYHGSTTIDVPYSVFDALGGNDINVASMVDTFRVNADDPFFDNSIRKARYETPRYLNSGIIINSNTAPNLTSSGGEFKLGTDDKHIHLSVPNGITFDNNTSDDEIKLAFSIIRANVSETIPDPFNMKILVQFVYDESSENTEYANMQIELTGSDISGTSGNSYFVKTKKISELFTTSSFAWSKVRWVKIAAKTTTTTPTTYYISLDALRFENLSDIIANPNYGMIGYTKVKKGDPGTSIIKEPNFSGSVEFRFIVDVGDLA